MLKENILSRLGSRFSLNFRPRERRVYLSPIGTFYDSPFELILGTTAGDRENYLPFSELKSAYDEIYEETTASTISYRCVSYSQGIEAIYRFISPFYPKDVSVSCIPAFIVDIEIRPRHCSALKGKTLNGNLVFGIKGPQGSVVAAYDGAIDVETEFKLSDHCWYMVYGKACGVDAGDISESTFKGRIRAIGISGGWAAEDGTLTRPFVLDNDSIFRTRLGLMTFYSGHVLEAKGEKCVFNYLRQFSSLDDVTEYCLANHEHLICKTSFFDSLIEESSLSRDAKKLIQLGFQSYLSNTWWVFDGKGKDWFSVWEGWCNFQSTIDVEYNISIFYLLFWPELLEKTFDEWSLFVKDGFMSHDMGILLKIDRQYYPHDMEVEENCNFILMAYALWKICGRPKAAVENYHLIKKFVEYIINSDLTGDGFPEVGVANTIDDGSPAVQYARKQTYLAIKSMSACIAAIYIASKQGDHDFARLCRERASLIARTAVSRAWLGDHFAVCIDNSSAGLRDTWTKEELKEEVISGWDGYSIYTANGLVYLLMAGEETFISKDLLAIDILHSTKNTLTEFGCFHTSGDRRSGWISQNLWRDYAAAYLGVDNLKLTENYWAFEEYENVLGRGGCFIDTIGSNLLDYYPRGVSAMGLFLAALGLKVDRAKNTIDISPISLPVKMPLLLLADWENGSVPWVEIHVDGDGKAVCSLSSDENYNWPVKITFYGNLLPQTEVTIKKKQGAA